MVNQAVLKIDISLALGKIGGILQRIPAKASNGLRITKAAGTAEIFVDEVERLPQQLNLKPFLRMASQRMWRKFSRNARSSFHFARQWYVKLRKYSRTSIQSAQASSKKIKYQRNWRFWVSYSRTSLHGWFAFILPLESLLRQSLQQPWQVDMDPHGKLFWNFTRKYAYPLHSTIIVAAATAHRSHHRVDAVNNGKVSDTKTQVRRSVFCTKMLTLTFVAL